MAEGVNSLLKAMIQQVHKFYFKINNPNFSHPTEFLRFSYITHNNKK